MKPQDATALASMEPVDLSEELLAYAARVASAAKEGKSLEVAIVRDLLRAASDAASGAQLHLLEIAEAFVRAISRSDLTPQELAVKSLLAAGAEGAVESLSRLLRGEAIAIASLKLTEHWEALLEAGVLRQQDARVFLVPNYFALVRDLLEPLPFRLWRAVRRARQVAAYAPANEAAEVLEQHLGVSQAQAAHYLRTFPLNRRTERALFKHPTFVHSPVRRPPPTDDQNVVDTTPESVGRQSSFPRIAAPANAPRVPQSRFEIAPVAATPREINSVN